MNTKDQSLPTFTATMIEKQLQTPTKGLQSDNGGEFLAFKIYLSTNGIIHRFSCPHTPQQNGRAERKIRHVETGLALSAQASLHSKFWMQSFQTAIYLINLLPTKVLHYQTPLQILFHKIPNYNHLRIFGCLCFPSLRPYIANKLSHRSIPYVFLGYAHSHKGYLCFDSESGHFYASRQVLFFEDSFPFRSSLATSSSPQQLTSNCLTPALLPTHIPTTHSVSSTSPDAPPPPSFTPSSKTQPSPIPVPFLSSDSASLPSPVNAHHMVTWAKSGIKKKKAYLTQSVSEPRSYTQASKSTEWIAAMNVEYQALHRNKTWCLVSPPSNAHVVGCHWIMDIKNQIQTRWLNRSLQSQVGSSRLYSNSWDRLL